MNIFFSVGEPSGDLHGANLIRELRSRLDHFRAVGYGGPQMAAAGCQLHEDLTKLAVMWLAQVLPNLHKFLSALYRADCYFRRQRPDAVVLIDFPGFNWLVAWRAKVYGIPVFYYGPPQIWAWASWRIRKMRRRVDHILCKLPFEEQWYLQRGCPATFVGHPYFDQLAVQTFDSQFLKEHQTGHPLVTLLPGSRTQEVNHNLRWLLQTAALVQEQVPETRFAVAAFRSEHATLAHSMIAKTDLPVEIFVGRTQELIHLANCCLAVSGSVSLELLYHTKPTVILYWVNPLAYFLQKFFRKVKYITLVNLLNSDELYPTDLSPYDPQASGTDKVLMPEYLTWQDKTKEMASHLVRWLSDWRARQETVAALTDLRDRVAVVGASGRAAEYLVTELKNRRAQSRPTRPHFAADKQPTSAERYPRDEDVRRRELAVAQVNRFPL